MVIPKWVAECAKDLVASREKRSGGRRPAAADGSAFARSRHQFSARLHWQHGDAGCRSMEAAGTDLNKFDAVAY